MISKYDVIPSLLEVAPGFLLHWEAHLEYWGDDERGAYNDAAVFARYVVEAYASGETDEFPAIFDTIEKIIREGDEGARNIATIGVLEDIQTIASNKRFGQKVFVHWLGPESYKAWVYIDKLWSVAGGSLAGVIRLESQIRSGELEKPDVKAEKKWWQFWK